MISSTRKCGRLNWLGNIMDRRSHAFFSIRQDFLFYAKIYKQNLF